MFIYLSWLPLNWNEMEDRRNRESRALYRASMFLPYMNDICIDRFKEAL